MNFEYRIEGVGPEEMGEHVRIMQVMTNDGIPLRVTVAPGAFAPQQWLEFFQQHLTIQSFTENPDGSCAFVFAPAYRVLH